MMKRVLLGFLLLISSGLLITNFKNYKSVDSEDLAIYVNDELVSSIPKKGEAMFIKAVCDNDGKASWDNENWGLMVTNMSKKTKCNLYFYEGQTVFDFDYTGGEQVFTVPVSGTYKLETWGAQGEGWPDYIGSIIKGGVGGYSTGTVNLNVQNKVYVNVGRENQNGSNGQRGGGATHFALKSGTLPSLENYISDILIVSGG